MRIRIVQKPTMASIDGIRLDLFEPGGEFEVGPTLAALLLVEGFAEPVDAEPSPPLETRPDPPPPVASRDSMPPNLYREDSPPYLDRELATDQNRPHRSRRRARKRTRA
jgi:hypothetical protein